MKTCYRNYSTQRDWNCRDNKSRPHFWLLFGFLNCWIIIHFNWWIIIIIIIIIYNFYFIFLLHGSKIIELCCLQHSCGVQGGFFFFPILWCSETRDHPQEYLANFGYRPSIKLLKKYESFHILATCWKLLYKYVDLDLFSESGKLWSIFSLSFFNVLKSYFSDEKITLVC